MRLGLKIGTVALVPHDCGWAEVFAWEMVLLRRLLGQHLVGIEHVGSTAVSGLKAKPIIDIVIGVHWLEQVPAWAFRLKSDGYVYFGDQTKRRDHFFAKTLENVETIYLHVVQHGGAGWRSFIDFRSRLCTCTNLRTQYEQLKENLAADCPDERRFYAFGKTVFFAHLREHDG